MPRSVSTFAIPRPLSSTTISTGGGVVVGTNTADGRILGQDSGIVALTGGGITVTTNEGLIAGVDLWGLDAAGAILVDNNSGTIYGGQHGIFSTVGVGEKLFDRFGDIRVAVQQ